MTRKHTDNTEVKGSQITIIKVSFEDLKQALRSRRELQDRGEIVLRISPSWGQFDEVETAKIAQHNPRTISPDGKQTFNLHPGLLYGAKHRAKVPDLAHYPSRLDERIKCRDHHGLDEEKELGVRWNNWWEEALTVWENALKRALRDEVDLYGYRRGPNGPSVTVDIEWTDID